VGTDAGRRGGEVVIYLWTAGSATGTGISVEAAFWEAFPFLPAGGEAVVREAVVELLPAGAGLVPGYRRTGKAWRGRLEDGALSWERAAEPEALAG
jgi:hypothetical protein